MAGLQATRDGRTSAVEGATRFRGCRPYIATPPSGVRSARPSTCRRGVSRRGGARGNPNPSRGAGSDTRADGRGDRGGPRDSADGGAARPARSRGAPAAGSRPNSRRGRNRRRGRSRRAPRRRGTSEVEARPPGRRTARPRPTLTRSRPCQNVEGLPGSSLRRVSPRGPGAATLGPHLAQLSRLPYPSAAAVTHGSPAWGACGPQPRQSVRDGPGHSHHPAPTHPRRRADSRPDLRGLT